MAYSHIPPHKYIIQDYYTRQIVCLWRFTSILLFVMPGLRYRLECYLNRYFRCKSMGSNHCLTRLGDPFLAAFK